MSLVHALLRRTESHLAVFATAAPSMTLLGIFKHGLRMNVWGNSLWIGHGRVLSEGEVVGDVFVVRQPAVCPYQPIWTHSHLDRETILITKPNLNLWKLGFSISIWADLTRISEPWMMKERVWFFGTTAWTRGRPSHTTWGQHRLMLIQYDPKTKQYRFLTKIHISIQFGAGKIKTCTNNKSNQ